MWFWQGFLVLAGPILLQALRGRIIFHSERFDIKQIRRFWICFGSHEVFMMERLWVPYPLNE